MDMIEIQETKNNVAIIIITPIHLYELNSILEKYRNKLIVIYGSKKQYLASHHETEGLVNDVNICVCIM